MMFAAILLSVMFLCTLLFRYYAGLYLADAWYIVCVTYAAEKMRDDGWDARRAVRAIEEYSAIWPIFHIVIHFWIWDFRYFVINQDKMQIILDYFVEKRKVSSHG